MKKAMSSAMPPPSPSPECFFISSWVLKYHTSE
jgi:hypothetical protein